MKPTPPRRPRSKLFFKFAAVTMLIITATLAGMSLVLFYQQKSRYEQEMKTRWTDLAHLTGATLSNAMVAHDYAFVETFAKRVAQDGDILYVAVYDVNLVLRVHSSREGILDEQSADAHVRNSWDRQTTVFRVSHPENMDHGVVEIAFPYYVGKEAQGVGKIVYSTRKLDEVIAAFVTPVVKLALLFLLLGILGSLFLARHVAGPVTRLATAARRVAAGDLDVSCALRRTDELGALADSFEGMVTNLKVARDELEGERVYMEDILESMIDSIVVVECAPETVGTDDVVPRIHRINRATTDLLGYEQADLIDRPVDVILGGAENREDLMSRLFSGGSLLNFDFQYFRKSGDAVPVRFSGALLSGRMPRGRHSDEDARSFVFVATDVSELKRVEKMRSAAYRVSESMHSAQTLADLYESVHGILGELIPADNFYIALADPREEGMRFPYYVDLFDNSTEPRILDRGLTDYLLQIKKPLLLSATLIDDLVKAGMVESGGTKPVEWMGAPLMTKERIIGAMVVQSHELGIRYRTEDRQLLTFISDQVAMAIERKLAEEERARLSSAVEQAADAILITDGTGNIEYVNPAFERMSGYPRNEALGKKPGILKSGRHDAAFYQRLWHTISSGEAWTGRIINKHKDGTEYEVEAAISPVRDAAGRRVNYVCVHHDITHEVALESQLRQSQKMEAVGKLAGGVAHDFNNLLSVVMGYTEMLLEELPSSDPVREKIEEVNKAGNRASTLTRQLLAFSRRQVLKPRVLNLNSVISDMKRLLRRLIGEDVELETHLDPALGSVVADPGQIEQVLMNLVVNARDAMPQGGTLIIETENVLITGHACDGHDHLPPGPCAALKVTDTGEGMDQETTTRIFEPFFTTKEVGKGTGLGLSTVYGIVKQSGGHVTVYSERHKGTTFKLYLPLMTELPDAGGQIQGASAIPRGTETVLLAEDEDGVRRLIHEILSRYGYTVIEASNGEEAMEVAAGFDGHIDLLLTDVVMPRVSGRELADMLVSIRTDLKVIFMSGYTDAAIVHHGVLAPGTAFLEKPVAAETLARKLRAVLDGAQETAV